MNADTLWLALALVVLIEGLFPFISPSSWRRMFTQVLALNDGQLRFFGLGCILCGLLMIWWLL